METKLDSSPEKHKFWRNLHKCYLRQALAAVHTRNYHAVEDLFLKVHDCEKKLRAQGALIGKSANEGHHYYFRMLMSTEDETRGFQISDQAMIYATYVKVFAGTLQGTNGDVTNTQQYMSLIYQDMSKFTVTNPDLQASQPNDHMFSKKDPVAYGDAFYSPPCPLPMEAIRIIESLSKLFDVPAPPSVEESGSGGVVPSGSTGDLFGASSSSSGGP